MMNEVISKHFAEFVIFKLVNPNGYEDGAAFITEGTLKDIKVVVVENSDNRSGKIQTLRDVYVSLLLEYLDHIEKQSNRKINL